MTFFFVLIFVLLSASFSCFTICACMNHTFNSLDVSRLPHMTDDVCSVLANSCTDLRNLDISRCQNITSAGFSRMVSGCSKLEVRVTFMLLSVDIRVCAHVLSCNGLLRYPVPHVAAHRLRAYRYFIMAP